MVSVNVINEMGKWVERLVNGVVNLMVEGRDEMRELRWVGEMGGWVERNRKGMKVRGGWGDVWMGLERRGWIRVGNGRNE